MATFTITVTENVPAIAKPIVIDRDDNSCEENITIRVIVPAGQSRHVTIEESGTTLPDTTFTETITADKDYTLILSGDQSTGQQEIDTIRLTARLTASSEAYYSREISRRHSGNFC
jgi:hypothetical protein